MSKTKIKSESFFKYILFYIHQIVSFRTIQFTYFMFSLDEETEVVVARSKLDGVLQTLVDQKEE